MFENKKPRWSKVSILFVTLIFSLFSFQLEARPQKINFKVAHVPNQLIIKYKKGFSSQVRGPEFLKYSGAEVVQQFRSNGAVLVEMPQQFFDHDPLALKRLAYQLSRDPRIEYVEPNYILHSRNNKMNSRPVQPNDPKYKELYGLADIHAPQAWQVSTGSRDVLVAIIDSGVDYNHVDIAPNYWTNPGESGVDRQGRDKRTNGIDDDQNGYVDDWRGWNFAKNNNNPMDDTNHGTHCAGVIGAAGNNGIGVIGVNWNVSLMGLKFLDESGSGSLANAVLAVEYATDMGVHITSNSWGGDEYSETMAAAIRRARDAGVLFVVAAGNDSNDNNVGLDYPSAYNIENIISVAAVDNNGELAGFSNYGSKTVHLAAPGVQILSTIPGDTYESLDGTSMAAPYVSGAAALIKAKFPHLQAREIKARLLGGATLTPALKGQVITGLLNIENSLEEDNIPPQVPGRIFVVNSSAAALDLEWDVSRDNGRVSTAFDYEVRIASIPIVSEGDWKKAIPVELTKIKLNGVRIQARGQLRSLNQAGYLAVRSMDRNGNLSGISESVPYKLRSTKVVYSNKGDSLLGVQITGNWSTEDMPGVGTVISDSPGGAYGYGKTTALTLPAVKIDNPDVVLTFHAHYEFEVGYDFAYVEISADEGRSWNQVAVFNGGHSWSSYVLPLGDFISSSDRSVLVRFRITTDPTTALDGLYLSNIVILN